MDPIDLLGVGSHAVGQDDRVVIQIIGVRHGGADAAVRLRADDDDIFHVVFPQYKVQIGAEKGAVAALFDRASDPHAGAGQCPRRRCPPGSSGAY